MKRPLALSLGFVLMFCWAVAPTAGNMPDSTLYSKSLDDAKKFSGSNGIQPKPVDAPADGAAIEQYATSEAVRGCEAALQITIWQSTCMPDSLCSTTMPGCGTTEAPSASPGGIIVLILALGALAFLLMSRMKGVKERT